MLYPLLFSSFKSFEIPRSRWVIDIGICLLLRGHLFGSTFLLRGLVISIPFLDFGLSNPSFLYFGMSSSLVYDWTSSYAVCLHLMPFLRSAGVLLFSRIPGPGLKYAGARISKHFGFPSGKALSSLWLGSVLFAGYFTKLQVSLPPFWAGAFQPCDEAACAVNTRQGSYQAAVDCGVGAMHCTTRASQKKQYHANRAL